MLNVVSKNCINLYSWMNPDFDVVILIDRAGMTDKRFELFKEIADEAFDEWFLPEEESSAYYSGICDFIRECLEEYFEPNSFEIYFKEQKGE